MTGGRERSSQGDNKEVSGTGEIVLYQTADGATRVECRFEDESIWLSQALIIDAFRKSFDDPDKEDKANIIHRPHDRMTDNKPIEFIQATNPIVIVVESKGALFSDDLRPAEKAKIDCGRKHFEALDTGVRFTVANNYDTFAERVAEG